MLLYIISLFLVTSDALPTMTHASENDVTDYLKHERLRRALPAIIKSIISGCLHLPSGGRNYKLYWKKGTYSEAAADFRFLQPTNRKIVGNVKIGQVDDRTVMLIPNLMDGTATLEFWQYKKLLDGNSAVGAVDIINYSNKVKLQ